LTSIEDTSESLLIKLEAMEKKLVFDALDRAGGNKSQAARDLGISEKNIRDRLKKWEEKG
jgi:DNA-binding NtrC family response regulator